MVQLLVPVALRFGLALGERWRARRSRGARAAAAVPAAACELIYRLRAWPDLCDQERTAEVYRMLSVMSSRPVNRSWILSSSRMTPKAVDQLLKQLVASGAVEVIDPSRFAPREA